MTRRQEVRDARRAAAADRDEHLYARKRARQARRRAAEERRNFDPAPPDDTAWTVPDDDDAGLQRVTPPTVVGDALQRLLEQRGWGERLRGAAAGQRWSEVVGPELAGRCEPVRLAGGILVVRAENQVWATQLRYLTDQIRQNAQVILGGATIREVRVVVGPLTGKDV